MSKASQDAAPSRRHGQDAVHAAELETLPLTSARATEELQDDDIPALPSYDDSEASVAAHQVGRSDGGGDGDGESHVLQMERSYVPFSGIDEERETMLVVDKRLNDPVELQRFIEEVVTGLPPRFGVKVVGTHTETRYNNSSKKTEESTVEDFSITMSMRQYLGKAHDQRFWGASVVTNGDHVYRGSWKRSRAVGQRQDIEIGDEVVPDLQDWCHNFCKSANFLKVFRVTRSVYGVDEEYLRKNIERVIRTTHYHGKINVSFYTGARNVDIRPPHWVNTIRNSAWAFFFYVTFLWIITWPILFFATPWWTVYTVRWNWVYSLNDEQHVHKIYAGVSEKAWIDIHQNLLKSLVMEKFTGDASTFPKNVSDARISRMMGDSGAAGSSSSSHHVNEPLHTEAPEDNRMGLWNDAQRSELRDPRAWGDDR